MNYKDIVVCDIYINTSDAPDFADSYIESAYWKSTGLNLTSDEIDALNEDGDFLYEAIIERLH